MMSTPAWRSREGRCWRRRWWRHTSRGSCMRSLSEKTHHLESGKRQSHQKLL